MILTLDKPESINMVIANHFPEKVWEAALVVDGESQHYRMDTVWTHIIIAKL